MKWTEELDNALIKAHEDGLSASMIAERLGNNLTRNAILGRSFRLGLFPGKKPLITMFDKPAKKGQKRQKRTVDPQFVVDHIMDYRDMGLTWDQIGAIYNTKGINARRWAIDYGGYLPPKLRYFTDEEDFYIIKSWNESVTVEDIADKLGRSFGTVRQRILRLKRNSLIETRDPAKTRLLRQYGQKALEAGSTPTEALRNIRDAKMQAFATARQMAVEAKTKLKKTAMFTLRANMDAGMERDEAIFRARSEGVILNELAEEFGLTRERIRQICIKHAEMVALKSLLEK